MPRTILAALSAALAFATAVPALAQDYPAKPLRMIVPVAASGMTDIVARLFAQKLQERLGQAVVVENRGGAGGGIGTEAVARSAPDGYTLLMAYPGPLVVNPSLFKNVPYDPIGDFAPVTLLTSYPMVLAVHPEVPTKNVAEFIALAKKNPGGLRYGSAGNGSTSHMAMELLAKEAGIELSHIPYKGAAPAMNDLMGGRLQTVFDSLTLVMPQHKGGKIRALAVSSRERSSAAPELPTIAESGVKNFEVSGWYGVLVPAKTPRAVVERLNRELVAIVGETAVRERLVGQGLEPIGKDGAVFSELIRREKDVWQRLVTEKNIRAD